MQYVVVNHVTKKHQHHVHSDKISINTGVPQGSILDPVLYILYTNDLENAFDAKITMYTDDTAIILSNKSNMLLEENGNIILETIENWFSLNCQTGGRIKE